LIADLAGQLAYNRTVQNLYLGSNKLTDVSAIELAQMLRVNSTLECVFLEFNLIGDLGMQQLAEALACNKTSRVRELHLSGNQIGNVGAIALGSMLQANRHTMRKLQLDVNKIGDEGMQALGQSLRKNIGGVTISNYQQQTDAYTKKGQDAITEGRRENERWKVQMATRVQCRWRIKTGQFALHMKREAKSRLDTEEAVMLAAVRRVQAAWQRKQGNFAAHLKRQAMASKRCVDEAREELLRRQTLAVNCMRLWWRVRNNQVKKKEAKRHMEQMATRVQCRWRIKKGQFALYMKKDAKRRIDEERAVEEDSAAKCFQVQTLVDYDSSVLEWLACVACSCGLLVWLARLACSCCLLEWQDRVCCGDVYNHHPPLASTTTNSPRFYHHQLPSLLPPTYNP
jgi:hypothetical protein